MPKNGKVNWKNFDIEDAVGKDLNAAIAFLCLIRDNPELLQMVVKSVEEWRVRMIEKEKEEKEIDKKEKEEETLNPN